MAQIRHLLSRNASTPNSPLCPSYAKPRLTLLPTLHPCKGVSNENSRQIGNIYVCFPNAHFCQNKSHSYVCGPIHTQTYIKEIRWEQLLSTLGTLKRKRRKSSTKSCCRQQLGYEARHRFLVPAPFIDGTSNRCDGQQFPRPCHY